MGRLFSKDLIRRPACKKATTRPTEVGRVIKADCGFLVPHRAKLTVIFVLNRLVLIYVPCLRSLFWIKPLSKSVCFYIERLNILLYKMLELANNAPQSKAVNCLVLFLGEEY